MRRWSQYLLPTLLLLATLSSPHVAYSQPPSCTTVLSPENFTVTAIANAPSSSVVCLLPGVYHVSGDVNVLGKSLTLQGLGSDPSDVRIVLSAGSIKLAPAENDTVVVRGISIEATTNEPAIQIYWSGKKGAVYDIGSVILENLVVNATRAVATSIQVGPDVRLRSFELRGSTVVAGEIGVQVGPDTTVSGVIVIRDSTIKAGRVGVQVGPSTQVAEYLEISGNSIEAGAIGIQVGPPAESSQAPPSIGKLVVVRNRVAGSSKVLEVRSIVRDYAHVYLNVFLGDDSRATLGVDPNLVPADRVLFNTLERVTYLYRGRLYTNYLGNYYVDWTRPDDDGDGIVDEPREVVGELRDAYPLADPSILEYLELSWLEVPVAGEGAYVAMGGGVLVDAAPQSYLLIALALLTPALARALTEVRRLF